MNPHAESDALHERVQRFIDDASSGRTAEPFDDLALAIARFQVTHVAPVRRLENARGIDLGAARTASAIPAVPCDVFRLARVAGHAVDADERVFRTSGTSAGLAARGEHPFRTTATYACAAIAWASRMLFLDAPRLRVIALAPPPADRPDSSLGFMMDLFGQHLGGAVSFHVRRGELDVDSIADACRDARDASEAALVLGASFAFVHLLDAPRARSLALPRGSRVMQTGGFKGKSREVDGDLLRTDVATCFDVPLLSVVAEYGMTELSSQLYEGTLLGGSPGLYRAPAWVRVDAADPASLRPLPRGSIGIARIVDLANVDSAVAIQTADRVRVLTSGDVELLGRAPGAPPRGCSLAIDDILGGK